MPCPHRSLYMSMSLDGFIAGPNEGPGDGLGDGGHRLARVPRDATAHAGRDVAHNMSIDAVWLPDKSGEHAAAETAWARRFLQALQPHRAGVYVNFLDSNDDSRRVREAYGDQIYRRLAEVKAKYDPDNAFHNNKNIQPG